MIENAYAELAPFSWDRIVERHGHLAAIRESMLVLEDLPAATRAGAGRQTLGYAGAIRRRAELAVSRPGRADRQRGARALHREHRGALARRGHARAWCAHLRATGQLTAGLILRALLSGNLELFDASLAELSGLPQARVCALLHDRGGASLQALLIRAGLPESTFAAFRVALEASHETGYVDSLSGAARLRRRMVERVLTHCETDGRPPSRC